jgi:large subunit ribosomal protein L25
MMRGLLEVPPVKAAFELDGQPRTGVGRTENRRLRRAGKVPAIVYGGGETPTPLVLDHNALSKHMSREAFYTSIVTVKLDGKEQRVVVKDVQRHPVKPLIMHLDLQRVLEDQEITLTVPIHFLGEAAAKGVKEQGGVVEHLLTDVEVTCLPRYLPEYLEIDVSEVELNQILHLSDIKLPEGVSLVALGHDQDHPVVAINPPRREEEEAPAAEAAAEVPATQQTEPGKGEASS